MAGQADPSALQLTIITKVPSIPVDNSWVLSLHLKAAPEMPVLHERATVDVVAVLDVSGSMAWDYGHGTTMENHKLDRVKEAMAKAIQFLGRAATAAGGARNHLAVVPFSDVVKQVTPLTEMDEEGQRSVKNAVDGLKPGGREAYLEPLEIAAKILDERKAAEKDRLALIIFVSDGKDDHFGKDPNKIKDKLKQLELKYPIHAFGVVSEEDGGGGEALRSMADATCGSYTSINQDVEVVAEKLAQLSDKPTSIVAGDVSIHLRSLDPLVSLVRIESSSSLSPSLASDASAAGDGKCQIADDNKSAEITVGTVSSGEEREFTVYVNVPKGGQGVKTLEMLEVDGSYKQRRDQEQAAMALAIRNRSMLVRTPEDDA